ncbi:MAG: YitT family protein [Paludibacteraceae bacterium]|nr:YitT family protein [Paludibacteraceae bacterium]MBQ4018911.1 YitT family protein [Paludibacteraceae bacterium]
MRTIFEYLVIIFGIFPMALMVNWVLLPHSFVGGGLTGICSAIYYLTNGLLPSVFPEYGGAIPVWLTTFVFNTILLLIAGFTVGWRFCIRTMVGVAAITFWYRVIPILPEPIIADPWLGAIIGGFVFGLSLGCVLAANGSSGGTDIVAMIVNHYHNISLGNIMLACDVLIIASAFFLPLPESMRAEGGNHTYLQIKRVLYGVAMTISYTVAVDWLMARLHRSVHFLIYSSKYDEIATAINTTVNRGVTVLDGTGWYSKKSVKVISVLVRKPESRLVLNIVHDLDPSALVSIADVGGVFGSGFDKIKVK